MNRKSYILESVDQVLLMRYIKHSLVECKIIYRDGIEIDSAESVCEGYILDLSKLYLAKAYLAGCDLSMVDLGKTNLQNSILSRADLTKANLRGVDLRGANLDGANLTGTFWMEDDIKVCPQLKNAEFTHIFVESKRGIARMNKGDVFPHKYPH